MKRKIKEAILALELNGPIQKNEFWNYLNQIYLGQGTYELLQLALNTLINQ